MRTLPILSLVIMSGIAQSETLSLKLVDETGQPVTNATVRVSYASPTTNMFVNLKPVSDVTGHVVAEIDRQAGWILLIQQPGFYDINTGGLPPKAELNRTIVMRHVVKPVPLFALSELYAGGRVPVEGEWVGYDFEAGDWVAPQGKGHTTDIWFNFKKEFKGWRYSDEEIQKSRAHPVNRSMTDEEFRLRFGKWDAELDISFPGEKEGLVAVKDEFLPYCRLKMPHQAPMDGYMPTRHYSISGHHRDENMGFFLRTRVKLDEKGQIVSANYAKIMGDFQIDATGKVKFTYYFNPTPNDRNLEFDVHKNLFPPRFGGVLASEP